MTKQTAEEKKIAEGKKASKLANKKQAKNKVNADAKKLAEKQAMEIAASLPAGQGNAFLQYFNEFVQAKKHVRAANKVLGGVRAKLKGIKVDMAAFDRVFKLYEMDAADVLAKKATEALYEQQIGTPLSEDQKELITDIQVKRENAAASMSELNGGETGKEVGTGMVGHNSGTNGEAAPEAAKPHAAPERNETIGKNFRAAEAASTIAH